MRLTFLGAAQTVTGSKYLLETAGKKILIECGLYQGYKELRQRNWRKLPIAAAEIDAVILTHAHIDHSGYIPLLVKNGFKGKIYASDGTYDLCRILLPDSGFLQEEEANFANKYGYSKHKPALPLYTQADAEESLNYFSVLEFDREYELFPDIKVKLQRAGHIIGSSFAIISSQKKTVAFSGDIGRPNDKVMKSPSFITQVDYLVMESTYGDRLHDTTDILPLLEKTILATVARGGSIIIPAFAVGRAQSLLYCIYLLKQAGSIKNISVYLDSPMAVNATHMLCAHREDHLLTDKECSGLGKTANYVKTVDESKRIDADKQPKIIISASGMAEGGRILHHLKVYLRDPNSTILFTGYQANGTRGERILNGAKFIKIHGEEIPVLAHIEVISSASAHADYQEMLDWLTHFKVAPKKVFLIHGEANSALTFAKKIKEKFSWQVIVPDYLQEERL